MTTKTHRHGALYHTIESLTICLLMAMLNACTTRTKNVMQLPILATELGLGGTVDIEPLCPEERGGTGRMSIALAGAKSTLAPQSLRLDVAASKNGFTTGEFVTVYPIAAETKAFRSDTTNAKSSVHLMQALDHLHVGGGVQFKSASEGAWTMEGLEPGVNYYVRLSSLVENNGWAPEQVVRVQGPICPFDEVEK